MYLLFVIDAATKTKKHTVNGYKRRRACVSVTYEIGGGRPSSPDDVGKWVFGNDCRRTCSSARDMGAHEHGDFPSCPLVAVQPGQKGFPTVRREVLVCAELPSRQPTQSTSAIDTPCTNSPLAFTYMRVIARTTCKTDLQHCVLWQSLESGPPRRMIIPPVSMFRRQCGR